MEPPNEPNHEDCCNSGCNPCIFDIYDQQLKLFRCGKKKPEVIKENGISDLTYTVFILKSTKLLCKSHKILTFKRSIHNNLNVWWTPGDHFLYKYSSGNICTRAYTPIKLKSNSNEDYDFSIVVKCYENGLVSNYLFQLQEGAVTLWRGPYGSYTIKPNSYNRIIMIAQGTGIIPFITIIEGILNNEEDMTKIFLFYCCQSVDEVLFRDELYCYKSYWNFSYDIFIPLSSSTFNLMYEEPIKPQRFSCIELDNLKPFSNDQFLICGSTKFMDTYKGALNDKLDLVENIILF